MEHRNANTVHTCILYNIMRFRICKMIAKCHYRFRNLLVLDSINKIAFFVLYTFQINIDNRVQGRNSFATAVQK